MDVLIVDDHPFIHETLRAVVEKAIPGANSYAETTLESAIGRVRRMERIDLTLLDLGLPGYGGIEALDAFRSAFPNLRVAVISADEEPARVRAALAAGAVGYIPKSTPPRLMIAAVQLCAEGGSYVPREIMVMPPSRPEPSLSGLTQRQLAAMRLVLQGFGNRQIAERLEITENTAKQHLHAVYSKLGVSSRAEAIAAATRAGLKPH